MNQSAQSATTLSAPDEPNRLWTGMHWQGEAKDLLFDINDIHTVLVDVKTPFWVIQHGDRVGIAKGGNIAPAETAMKVLAMAQATPLESLGDPAFRATYATRIAYYAGAMAGAIASEELVIALARVGMLASFGAGGCGPARVEAAVEKIQSALPHEPYAFNLLHSPNEPSLEQRTADLYVRKNVPIVEASAYLDLTYALAHYRLTGLSVAQDGQVHIGHRIISKISRKEVARRFLSPAPHDLVNRLLEEGKITQQQAELSQRVPMADDITVEADSGGHTDNRPLVGLLPTMIALRDEMQAIHRYAQSVRIGAAGGIATPHAALAALMMGAAYIVTGSVNQACIEAGTSEHTRNLLAQADMADVAMAPSADMFEMGVKVQVLKRGTMFAPRAGKLYEIYSRYESWQDVPQPEREKLEKTILKRTYEDIWTDTQKFFTERDPSQLVRANKDPHQQMALVFRWYLGLSSRWSNFGEKGREMDYQIWCGPSMGTFNDWVRGTYLEKPENRRVVDVALHILTGAAYLSRLRALSMQGIKLPPEFDRYIPVDPLM